MSTESNNSKAPIAIISIVIAFLLFIMIGTTSAIQGENAKKECTSSGKVWVESSKTCREKTTSEKFDEKCSTGIEIDGTKYSCADIKRAGLEKAYVENKTIIKHGNSIYEEGTSTEISAGKMVGDYCLSASDTWSHIGETRCVVFYPQYFARSGYNFFIDEKENYKTGFVIYMYGNYSWDDFLATYKDKGEILVCGQITSYQGHPQIKANPSNILVSPNKTMRGGTVVYNYRCK